MKRMCNNDNYKPFVFGLFKLSNGSQRDNELSLHDNMLLANQNIFQSPRMYAFVGLLLCILLLANVFFALRKAYRLIFIERIIWTIFCTEVGPKRRKYGELDLFSYKKRHKMIEKGSYKKK